MMRIITHNGDNESYSKELREMGVRFDLIYMDMIYEDTNFQRSFLRFFELLTENGIFIIQTDHHTVFKVGSWLEHFPEFEFINHLVWKNEWGNHPKNKFHQCFDDILIYANGDYTFHSERVQVPKVTKTKGLNPSGRETKTATAWIDDICLTTTANERVKKSDGHLIRWQKPLKLYDRIILPFIEKGFKIYDPYMGSGSLGKWCTLHPEFDLNYLGVELDKEVYELAQGNIYGPI